MVVKKGTSKKRKFNRPRTLNITPVLLKLVVSGLIIYILYGVLYWGVWGIFPYTFGYTFYIVDKDYVEYSIEDGDILILRQEFDVGENEVIVERVGTSYNIKTGVRRPYGVVVVKDILGSLKKHTSRE